MANEMPYNPLEGERPELTLNLQDQTDEQISITVIHKDTPEYLNICLQSIAVTSFNNNYELIVVDNGSGQETQDFLDDIEGDVKVIRNEKNLYWSAAANKGAKAASKNSKYLIFMHSDVVITNSAWLDLLVSVSDSHKSGYVGIELGTYYMQQQRVDFVQEHVCLFTRECWENCGPWNEELPQIGHSFVMSIKCQNRGFSPQVMKNPICHHYKNFGLSINEYEILTEEAMKTLPRIINSLQTQPVTGL